MKTKKLIEREVAEKLWSLLDHIDTLSDICKPTLKNPKAAMAFYNNAMKYAAKRFELLKSDGYKIYTPQEFKKLPKQKPSMVHKDSEIKNERKLKVFNESEVKDKFIGKKGTEQRKRFDKKVEGLHKANKNS